MAMCSQKVWTEREGGVKKPHGEAEQKRPFPDAGVAQENHLQHDLPAKNGGSERGGVKKREKKSHVCGCAIIVFFFSKEEMSAVEAMEARRSCRKFDAERAVPRDALETIVACAQRAPTAMNAQKLRFYAVAAPAAVAEIGASTEAAVIEKFPHLQARKASHGVRDVITYGAPAAVVVTAPADVAEAQAAMDAGFAAQNVLLAAESLGLGAVPVGLARLNAEAILRRVGAEDPQAERLLLLIPIGYKHPDYVSKGLQPAKEITSRVFWVDQ